MPTASLVATLALARGRWQYWRQWLLWLRACSQNEPAPTDPILELIDQIKALPGVSGIHLMSVGWESILPRLLEEARFIPHPA